MYGMVLQAFGIGSLHDAAAGSLMLYLAAGAGAYALYEQLRFKIGARSFSGKQVPGPSFVIPFLGGLIQMVKDPYGFWERQRQWASDSGKGFSYNSLFGKMILFITDAEKSREMMALNDPSKMLMVLHPSAKNILGKDNMAFDHGPAHKAIRKSFLSLFTRKALSVYVSLQDGLIRDHISKWLASHEGKEVEIRPFIRDLNQMTSQEVFIGPYLDDPETKKRFTKAYSDMTDAFLAFPVCLPGTTVWKGRKGRLYVVQVLEQCAARARKYISGGGEPRCLIDFWVRKCLEEIAEAAEKGEQPPTHTTDYKIADASKFEYLCLKPESLHFLCPASSKFNNLFCCSLAVLVCISRCIHCVFGLDHCSYGRQARYFGKSPCRAICLERGFFGNHFRWRENWTNAFHTTSSEGNFEIPCSCSYGPTDDV